MRNCFSSSIRTITSRMEMIPATRPSSSTRCRVYWSRIRTAHSLSVASASIRGRSARIASPMGASQVPPPARHLPIRSRSLTSPTITPPRLTATAPIFFCAMSFAASRQGVEASRLTTSRTTFLWMVAMRVLLAQRAPRCRIASRASSSSEAEGVPARSLPPDLARHSEGARQVPVGDHFLHLPHRDDRALAEQQSVRHERRNLLQVVCHQHHRGGARPRGETGQVLEQALAREGVEPFARLVQDQERRRGQERARDQHPLALPFGERP